VLDAVAADVQLAGRHAIFLLTALANTLPLALVQLMDRLGVGVIGKPFDIDPLVEAVTRAAQQLAGEGGEALTSSGKHAVTRPHGAH
jgi:hypothetical protein